MPLLIVLYIMMGLLLSSASCQKVEIMDEEWCVDKGTLGAHCAHTLSTVTEDIPQPDWDNRRFGQACTIDPPGKLGSTLAEIKKEQEEICSIYNACTYEEVNALHNFLEHMISVQKGLNK